jgi:hypothetical protein
MFNSGKISIKRLGLTNPEIKARLKELFLMMPTIPFVFHVLVLSIFLEKIDCHNKYKENWFKRLSRESF